VPIVVVLCIVTTRKSLPLINVRAPAVLLLDLARACREEGIHPALLGYQLRQCSYSVAGTGREAASHQEACRQVGEKAYPVEEIQLRRLVERVEGTACPEEVGKAYWVACSGASLGLRVLANDRNRYDSV